ncbi:MAG: S41 family peptidase [Bacteroidota bacterium]
MYQFLSRLGFITYCCLAFMLTTAAQPSPALNDFHSVTELREDLRLVQAHLHSVHGSLYTYHSPARFEAYFDSLSAEIRAPMSTLSFYKALGPLNRLIADAHTAIQLPDSYYEYLNTEIKMFPFGVRYLQDKLYLTVNLSNQSELPMGVELININGQNALDVFRQLQQYFERDGFNLSSPNRACANQFQDLYGLIYGSTELFELEVKSSEGERLIFQVDGDSWPVIAPRLAAHFDRVFPDYNAPPPLEFKIENAIGQLRIRSFHPGEIAEADLDFRSFFRSCFEQLHQNKVGDLIIDLRGNGGGSEDVFMPLLSYLLDTPFIVYEDLSTTTITIPDHQYYPYNNLRRLERRAKRNYRPQAGRFAELANPATQPTTPQAPHFQGRVFVLTDANTHSAAGDFCGVLLAHQRAEFVGQESGGNPYQNTAGERITLVLPHSRLEIGIPLLRYVIAGGLSNPGRGVIPSYSVEISPQQAIEYADPVLPFVLQLIEN